MDTGAPPENTALIEALKGGDRQEILKASLSGYLLIPTRKPIEGDLRGWFEAENQEQAEFIILRDQDGEGILAIFSDEDQLAALRPEGLSYLALPAKVLFGLAVKLGLARVAINPVKGGAAAVWLTKEDAEELAGGRIPAPPPPRMRVTHEQAVRIGLPTIDVPDGLPRLLSDAFEEEPAVEKAVFFAITPPGGEERLVLGLDVEGQPEETVGKVLHKLKDPMAEILGKGRTLDVFFLRDEPAAEPVKHLEPFYEKKE